MSESPHPYDRYVDLVYVAGPYTATPERTVAQHIDDARLLGCMVASMGALPVIPHMNTAHMDNLQPWGWWIDATLELMYRCNAVVMLPGWERSRGAKGEHDKAKEIGIPVFYDMPTLAEWVAGRIVERDAEDPP